MTDKEIADEERRLARQARAKTKSRNNRGPTIGNDSVVSTVETTGSTVETAGSVFDSAYDDGVAVGARPGDKRRGVKKQDTDKKSRKQRKEEDRAIAEEERRIAKKAAKARKKEDRVKAGDLTSTMASTVEKDSVIDTVDSVADVQMSTLVDTKQKRVTTNKSTKKSAKTNGSTYNTAASTVTDSAFDEEMCQKRPGDKSPRRLGKRRGGKK